MGICLAAAGCCCCSGVVAVEATFKSDAFADMTLVVAILPLLLLLEMYDCFSLSVRSTYYTTCTRCYTNSRGRLLLGPSIVLPIGCQYRTDKPSMWLAQGRPTFSFRGRVREEFNTFCIIKRPKRGTVSNYKTQFFCERPPFLGKFRRMYTQRV